MKRQWLVLCCYFWLVACTSPPTSYYRLQTTSTMPSMRMVTRPVLQVGPVSLPTWLNRAELVRIDASGQVILLVGAEWAAPLPHLLAEALARSIAPRLDWCQVRAWPSASPYAADWLVTLDVYSFAADTQRLRMAVDWQVRHQGKRIKGGTLTHEVPLAGQNVGALVAAYDQAVAVLADAVAASLKTMPDE